MPKGGKMSGELRREDIGRGGNMSGEGGKMSGEGGMMSGEGGKMSGEGGKMLEKEGRCLEKEERCLEKGERCLEKQEKCSEKWRKNPLIVTVQWDISYMRQTGYDLRVSELWSVAESTFKGLNKLHKKYMYLS